MEIKPEELEFWEGPEHVGEDDFDEGDYGGRR